MDEFEEYVKGGPLTRRRKAIGSVILISFSFVPFFSSLFLNEYILTAVFFLLFSQLPHPVQSIHHELIQFEVSTTKQPLA